MGVDYSATAIIGISLPEKDDLPKLKTAVRKKAFPHSYKDGSEIEFHPKTGAKLFLDEKVEVESDFPAFIYDLDESGNSELEHEGQKVIKAPKGLRFMTDYEELTCLGLVVETGNSNGGDYYNFKKLPDINALKDTLQKALEPYGLWDEKEFGLHVILNCG